MGPETYLPKQGASFRAQQIATLSETAHELFISDKLGDLLNSLKDAPDLSETEKCNVELSLEDYSKQRKFTPAFVRKLSESSSRAFHAWIEARKGKSFEPFRKPLETLVELKRQEADLLGYEGHCYNALLDAHDKGSTTQQLDALFEI
jgi:carboxypeptidase Taq